MQNENNSISSNEWGHGNAETTVNEIVLNLNNETVLPTKRLSNKKILLHTFKCGLLFLMLKIFPTSKQADCLNVNTQ